MEYEFSIPDNSTLEISITGGQRDGIDATIGIFSVIKPSVNRNPEHNYLSNWFDKAHDSLSNTFDAIVTDNVKEVMGYRKDNPSE